MHQTSRFATKPDEPVTRLPYSREGKSPPSGLGVKGETEDRRARDGAQRREQRPSRVGSAHRRATNSSGHAGAGVRAAKRGPRAAETAPSVSPGTARASGTHTPPPHARPRLSPSPLPADTHPQPTGSTTPRARAHTPLRPAARTYPATRRAHRGPRTAAASCQTWSRRGRQTRHPIHETGPGTGDGSSQPG